MRTETIQIFQYSELSDAAKSKARDWYREASAGDIRWDTDFMYEHFATVAKFCGFDIERRKTRNGEPGRFCIYWQLYVQGSGASFDADWRAADVDAEGLKEHAPQDEELTRLADKFARLASFAVANVREDSDYRRATLKQSGHYYHSHTVSFDFPDAEHCPSLEWEWRNVETSQGRWRADFKKASRDLMDWMYRTIEEEDMYCNEDGYIAETIEANDYEFTADGSIY
jgi:hypothetical protein